MNLLQDFGDQVPEPQQTEPHTWDGPLFCRLIHAFSLLLGLQIAQGTGALMPIHCESQVAQERRKRDYFVQCKGVARCCDARSAWPSWRVKRVLGRIEFVVSDRK